MIIRRMACWRYSRISFCILRKPDSWQEKWAVCEALGCFLKNDSYGTLASRYVDRIANVQGVES